MIAGDDDRRGTGAEEEDEEDVFIVRVRMETVENTHEPKAMRGRVEHLPSHHARYFRDFEVLFEFIVSRIWR